VAVDLGPARRRQGPRSPWRSPAPAAREQGMRVVLIEGDLAQAGKRPRGVSGSLAVEAGVYEATSGTQALSRCLYKDPAPPTRWCCRRRAPLARSAHAARFAFLCRNSSTICATAPDLIIVDAPPGLELERHAGQHPASPTPS